MSKPLARALSIVLAATLAAGAALVGGLPAQASPLAYVVDSAGDEAPGFVCDSSTAVTSPLTLRRALCLVDRFGAVSATVSIQATTVQVSAALGAIPVGAHAGDDLTVNSLGAPSTITSLGGGQLFNLDPQQLGGISVAFDSLTFSNAVDNTIGGAAIIAGSGFASPIDRLSVTNATFSNNAANTTGSATNQPGGAIQFLGGSLTVSNTTFTGNSSGSSAGGAIAYQATGAGAGEGLSVTGSRFSGNTMVNGSGGPDGGGAIVVDDQVGTTPLTISDSTFTGNRVTGSGASVPRGAAVLVNGGAVSITGSTFSGNTVAGGAGGVVDARGGTLALHYNRFDGTSTGSALYASGGAAVNATENWWGCGAAAGASGCDSAVNAGAASFSVTPYLKLSATASPALILPGNTSSTISSSLLTDSSGAAVASANLSAFTGASVALVGFTPAGAAVTPSSVAISAGTASMTFTKNSATGAGSVTVGLDKAQVTVPVGIGVAPAFTSATSAAAVVGSPASFTVTTTGYPAAALAIASGSLPTGLSFVDNGNGTATIAGTPAAGTAADYALGLTATSASGTATQSFQFVVDQKPAITSPSAVTFAAGSPSSFTVTTTGRPVPAPITVTGALPQGVSVTDNGNGTATVAGTPAVGSGGTYPLTVTAANGVNPAASQSLVLTVTESARFTSAASTTLVTGSAGAFSVVVTRGFPVATTLTESGALPAGLTFTDNGDGTATIAGTPAAGTGGVYPLTLTASNGTAPNATQAFVLTVQQAPTIAMGASPMTVNAGNPVTFSADADGFPVPTVAWSVSTDNGLTFNPVFGGITTTLSFTATQSQNGNIYRATFTNAAGSISTQARLTVGTAPTVSSDGAATFTAASGVQQFGVTTSGVPNAVITTSALPSWLTFTDNGDGTGTLSGDPAAGDGGAYPITITATNGFAPAATQSFVLTVTEPPTISSASAVSFGLGVAGSFVVQTAAGFPAATTVTRTGALPAGVTFVDNGDGTATLAGTPAAGTGGTYPLTLTASNGTGTDATQTLVLTVTVPPAITSAAAASFVLGVTGTFTVTATGVPRASLTTGVLPAWLTFADNGDGTGTFSGIPPVGSEGQHPITIAAHNGVGSGVSQSFVLTVTQTPVITSAAAATFTTGTFSAFTITTTAGYPTATTLTRTGALPAGVSFVDNGDGTATLAGTPAVGTGGLYGLTLTASNGTGAGTTRSFTLTVAQDPEFSSTNAATFTRGVDGTFTVTTRPSYPATTGITLTGSLPTGLSFADNGDGTATISGTTLDAAGTLTLGLTASNGSGPDAVQSFALTLADAATVPLPAILPTSDGPVGGVPSTVKPGDVLTLTASDFAGDAPVTFGIYSSPTVLAVVKADASGTATATVTIPAGLTGTHTLVASGIAPDGSRRFLLTAITLAGGSGSGSGGSGSGSGSSGSGSSGSGSGSPAAGSDPLASTGLTDVTGLALLAAFALIAGVSILTLRRRRS